MEEGGEGVLEEPQALKRSLGGCAGSGVVQSTAGGDLGLGIS